VSPSRERTAVNGLQQSYSVSERRACQVSISLETVSDTYRRFLMMSRG
jgi:hypothetical protein